MRRLLLLSIVVAAGLGLAAACHDELDIATTGAIVLNVRFADPPAPPLVTHVAAPATLSAPDQEGATPRATGTSPATGHVPSASASTRPTVRTASYTAVRARIDGPTTRTVNLTLNEGFWEGEATGLDPGTYTVTVEALEGNEITERGVTSGITVTAGTPSTASVSLTSFAPALAAIASPGTRLNLAVSWAAVTGADGYRVEWSKDAEFGGARSQTLDTTLVQLAIADTGTWNVRVRATVAAGVGIASAPRTADVQAEAAGTSGDDLSSAAAQGFGTAANGTLSQLNIAPAGDLDWYGIQLCSADTLIVQTSAAGLDPPSPLNTRLRLFASDSSLVAQNDDDGSSTDSRLAVEVPADDQYGVEVSGVSGTTGHYQMSIEVRPGSNNPGPTPPCLQPAVATVEVTPGTASLDALGATQQLTAVARAANNAVISGVTFTWDSDDLGVATVDATGLVTSQGNGSATITATAVVPAPPVATRDDSTVVVSSQMSARPEPDGTASKPRAARTPGQEETPDATAAAPSPASQPSGAAVVTVQQAPSSLAITPSALNFNAIGDTIRLAGEVQDRLGAAIAGTVIAWDTDNAGVATVDAAGLVTSRGNGSANINATSDTVGNAVGVTVLQAAAGVVKLAGDNQSAFGGTPLAQPLVVRVVDGNGAGVAGQTVSWTVTAGAGALSTANTVTGPLGQAQVSWTLGAAGGAQTVDATSGSFSTTFGASTVTGVQWINASGGLWTTGANWSTGTPPGPTDSVLIGLDGAYQVTLGGATTVAFLQITGAGGPQTLETAGNALDVTGTVSMSGVAALSITAGSAVSADTILNGGNGIGVVNGSITASYVGSSAAVVGLVPGGSVDVSDTWVNAGTIIVQPGGFLAFSGASFTGLPGGGIQLGDGAVLEFDVGTAAFPVPLNVDSAGSIVFNGTGVTAAGAFVDLDAQLELNGASLVTDTLHNRGSVSLDNATLTGPVGNDGFLAATAGTNTIDGRISTTSNSTVNVDGELTTLQVTRGFTNNGNLSFSGTPGGGGEAVLAITAPASLVNLGTIDFFDIPATVDAPVDNQGDVNVSSPGCCITITGDVANSGSGVLWLDQGDVSLSASLVNDADVWIEAGRTLAFPGGASTGFANNGTFRGAGTLDLSSGATFTSAGAMYPGGSGGGYGTLSVVGDVALMAASTVEFELLGQNPGVDMDQIVVSGAVTFDGTIDAIADPGFIFSWGNAHQIVTYGARAARFADTASFDYGQSYLRPVYGATGLTLHVTAPQVVVTPATATLTTLGATQQFSAEAQELGGTPIAGAMFTWSTSDMAIAGVDGTGLATANAPGNATIGATVAGGTAGTAALTISAAAIATVTVTPNGGTIDGVGNTLALSAEVRDAMDVVVPVAVTWTSLHPEVASVDVDGVVTAVGPGQTAIRAVSDTAVGYAVVSVAEPGLSPASVWADFDDDAPFAGTAFQDIWGSASWSNVWAVGPNGTVAKLNSCCPGTWGSVDIGAGTRSLTAIWGLGPDDVWIGAGTGEVFAWDGSQWAQLPAQSGGGVNAIWAGSPRDVWLAHPGGMVSHWDGSAWATGSAGTAEDLFAMWGTSSSDVWASGRNGALVHFTGGGWTPVGSNTTQNIVDLWGADANDIWAVALLDTLLHYDGVSWTPVTTNTGTSFTNIWGFDRQDVYVTGSNGTGEEIWRRQVGTWVRIATFDRPTMDIGPFTGLVGAPGCTPGTCPVPEPRLTVVAADGKMLRGILGASVSVAPPSPALLAPEDAVVMAVTITDSAGNAVPNTDCCGPPLVVWGTDDPGLIAIDQAGQATPVGGEGNTNVFATAFGGASGSVPITVDFAFTGAVTVNGTGAFADPIRILPGGVAWDGDEVVTIGGEQPWLDHQSVDSIVVRIPDLPVGTHTMEIGNQGPSQLTQSVDVNVTGSFTPNTVAASAPDISGNAFPTVFFISLSDASRDHWLAVNPSAANLALRVTMEWQTAADLDIYWTDNAGVCCTGNFDGAGGANPEVSGEVVAVGADWRIDLNKFDSGTPTSMARVAIAQTSIGASVTAGRFHSCAVGVDGVARCWGYNGSGQLGDGTTSFAAAPVDVAGGLRFSVVSAGAAHTCGVDEVGDAYCWGENSQGQLGNGTFVDSPTPTLVTGGLRFETLSAGVSTTCAVAVGGTVYCWGASGNGERGDGTTSTVSAPTPIASVMLFQSISMGAFHGCGVTTGGAAYCWGFNGSGQLGDGTNTAMQQPVAVVGPGGGAALTFTAISAGDNHTCAWLVGGAAHCWGQNGFGQLGDGTTSSTNTPVQVASGTWSVVDAGDSQTCGVTSAGVPQCWGSGQYGERGDGTTNPASTPTTVLTLGGAGPVGGISAGGDHSCGVDALGEAWCWGRSGSGQLGDGVAPPTLVPAVGPLASGAHQMSAGGTHACGVDTFGFIGCWGLGTSGQLGNGGFSSSASPVTVTPTPGLGYLRVSSGGLHSCAVDNGNAAACWGSGFSGQLGNGVNGVSNTAVTVSGGLNWTQVDAGGDHTCGVTTGGTAYCWGGGANGQLGNGADTATNVPVPVALALTWSNISAGSFHTCAVTTSGDGYCWGFNGVGELGNGASGSGASSNVPVLVSGGHTFLSISAGRQYTCGVTTANEGYCWGFNSDGQLGRGSLASSNIPALVAGGLSFRQVATGSGATDGLSRRPHTCGVTTGDALYCWGANLFGGVGDGTLETAQSPVLLTAPPVATVSVGGGFSCAVTTSTAGYCWGDNGEGQKGNGTRSIEATPVQVSGGHVFLGPPPALTAARALRAPRLDPPKGRGPTR